MKGLVGIVSGKRSKPRPTESSAVFRDRVAQLSQQSRQENRPESRPENPSAANIPIAARDSLSSSTEPVVEPATLSNAADNLAEPDPAAASLADQKPMASSSPQNSSDLGSTAAAADLADDVSIKPTFPTEVSELIGSPSVANTSDSDENISADFSVRTLKKLSDDRLPAIHDLLPAVEALPPEPVSPPSDIPDTFQPSEQSSEQSSEQPSEPPVAPKLSDDAPLASDSLLPPKQALLFSFDITQSEEPTTQLPDPVEQAPSTAKNQDSHLSASVEPSFAEVLPQSATNEDTYEDSLSSPQISTQDEALFETPEADAITNDVAEPAVEVKPLPYPWSLPASKTAPQPQSSAAQPVATNFADDDGDHRPSPVDQVVKNASEARLTKNGVVKLLFTIKEGNFHGYIEPDDGTKDILFHQKYINADIFSRLERGVKVVASVKYIEGKVYATHVETL
ncbi:MAG: cold shock domain-containing protein [Phormidesmis sp.]